VLLDTLYIILGLPKKLKVFRSTTNTVAEAGGGLEPAAAASLAKSEDELGLFRGQQSGTMTSVEQQFTVG
jgi:hypothetical protein